MLYQIPIQNTESTLDDLDYREKGGYTRLVVDVHLCESVHGKLQGLTRPPIKALTYVAAADNPNFAPFDHDIPAELHAACDQITSAEGPSGRSFDYLRQLWRFVESMGISDRHLQLLVLHCESKTTTAESTVGIDEEFV